jgi:tetratricopeptide (TPR) repeat protein
MACTNKRLRIVKNGYQGTIMGKNKKDTISTITKNSATLIAAATFVLGFLIGVGFTIYKTNPTPQATTGYDQGVDLVQQALSLEAELKRNPQNLQAWIQLGHTYYDSNQYSQAITAYEKSLYINPDNADVLTDLGVMYRRNGQPKMAIEKFDLAVAVNPTHEIARLNKGIVLLHDLKDRAGAIKAWEELLEINPVAMAGENQSVDQLIRHYKEGHDKQ